MDGVLEPLRLQLQRGIRGFITGSAEPLPRHTDDEPGLFGPDSVTWRVHADAAMFIGGLRALLLQTLHPPTMAGVADHSDYRHDPLGRLRRTAAFIGVTTYGTERDARRTIAGIRAVHDRVTGTLADGTPYRANDPHLLGWVHATEVDSFLRAYRRYGRAPLRPDKADAYLAEMAEVGSLLGVTDPPGDRAALRATLQRYRPELAATPAAREAVRFLLWPPFPAPARPVYGMIAGAAIGLLPAHARRLLRLPVPLGVEPFLVRPAAAALMRTLDWALEPAS